MSVNRFTVAERVDKYARTFFSGCVADSDLPPQTELEDEEPAPTERDHERPSWYTGRGRDNPDQDFRAR